MYPNRFGPPPPPASCLSDCTIAPWRDPSEPPNPSAQYNVLTGWVPRDQLRPTDHDASQDQKRPINVSPLHITNPQPPVLMQPRQGALDYSAGLAQAAAMISPSLPDHRHDQPLPQLTMMSLRMIRRVTLKNIGPFPGPTPLATDGRNGNPLTFGNDVAFRPLVDAVRRVRPVLAPPRKPVSNNCRLPHGWNDLVAPRTLLGNHLVDEPLRSAFRRGIRNAASHRLRSGYSYGEALLVAVPCGSPPGVRPGSTLLSTRSPPSGSEPIVHQDFPVVLMKVFLFLSDYFLPDPTTTSQHYTSLSKQFSDTLLCVHRERIAI